METKIFEIRDRSTFIPVMGVRLHINPADAANDDEEWLLLRAGYAREDIEKGTFILLITLSAGIGKAVCDPYDWGGNSLTPAHAFIAEHWAELQPGQVIDAEFIRGESTRPRTGMRFEPHGA